MACNSGLWTGFWQSAEQFAERPALVVADRVFRYRELREGACRIAATLQAHANDGGPPLAAVFGNRSYSAFVGVLGALLAGHGYVPLNRTFPVARTRSMFERSGCRAIIVDEGSLPQLEVLLDCAVQPTLVIAPETVDLESYRGQWPRHRFVAAGQLGAATAWREPRVLPQEIAYLLFTSGSTGAPKGVMVSNGNVNAFVEYMVDRYEVTEHDRFSQMFDLTFDLSAFDMFVAWVRGACVCCPSLKTVIKPDGFIRQAELTIWFSVPSVVGFMKQMGLLKPARFPKLRVSLFCGEPLPLVSAASWQDAAPNSIVENLYGPTELTIACTCYRYDQAQSPRESELGIVPIGQPYPGMKTLVVGENLAEVPPGEVGELLMSGPQLSLGYWQDPAKTAAAFVVPHGQNEVFYRTGDRVRRPIGDGPLTHLGRADFQVKVLGHRVELGEIEAAVRDASGLEGVVALGWPATPSGFGGVEVFLEGPQRDGEALHSSLTARLPDYMVPRRIHYLEILPRNANGKFDRNAMLALLEKGL